MPRVSDRHISVARKRGLSTVVSAMIMVAAMSILGSVMFTWANLNFSLQQKQISEQYEQTSNVIQEVYIIEDVWLSETPADYVNITLRNVGSIGIGIKTIQITNSTSSFMWTPPDSVVILPNESYRADVQYDWASECNSLDISVNSERGSLERVLWKMTC